MRRSTFRSRASTAVLAVCLGAALAVPTAMAPAGAQEAPPPEDAGVAGSGDPAEGLPPDEAPTETPPIPVSSSPGAKGGRVLSVALERLADDTVQVSRSGEAVPVDAEAVQSQLASLDLPSQGAGSIMVRGDGRVVVNINVGGTDEATVAGLEAAGARPITVSADYQMVSAEVAVGDLEALAAAPGVLAVTEVVVPMTTATMQTEAEAGADAPPVTNAVNCLATPTGLRSEGDAQLAAATARANSAVDGTGIKVGVLSDTYTRLGGAPTDVTNAELPGATNPCTDTTAVQVLDPGPAASGIDEGRAMLQIVHDLAPKSPLAFSSAFNGDLDFADEIRALQTAGSKVIVDDVSYFNEPFYQDGPIAKAVNDVTAAGVTYFSSAGNSTPASVPSGGSYEAPSYRNMACPATITAVDPGYVGCHDFDTVGADNGNTMTIPGGGTVFRTTLGWNEPMYGVGTDLDYFLINQATGAILTGSVGVNANTKSPVEYMSWTNNGSAVTAAVVVAKYGTGGTPRFKTIVHRNPATSVQFSASVNGDITGPTVFGHNATLKAGSIAAVPFDNANTIEPFSSRGPATYCWQPVNGTSVAAAMTCQTKNLDVAATDGTINSFFGSPGCVTCRFYGTSASAPHAAAIAALQTQKQPCNTPSERIGAQRWSGIKLAGFTVADQGYGRVTATTAITGLPRCGAPVAAGYHPLTPSRILDSRGANGGWNGKVAAGNPRDLQVTGRPGSNIPANASAVVMNVTATDSNVGSFLKVWPAYAAEPNVSNLNFNAGDTIPNLVTVKLGVGGMVQMGTSVGSAHVIADVVGYFDNGSGPGDRFTGIDPARLLDSRGNNGGWNGAKLTSGTTRDLTVRPTGAVPAGATAIIANVTVVGATQESFLRVWPSGEAEPGVSNLNFKAEQIIPNLVMVKIGTNGKISFSNAAGATHVVVDVVGYFNPSTGSKFFAVDPTRILDSRVAKGLSGPWSPGQTRDLTVAGAPGTNVPDAADGVIANVTVTDGTAQSLITVFPSGAGVPTASNLNFMAGQIVPNLVAVRIPANNKISIYNDQGNVNVIADVVGYFAPA